jgi:hypothetical protein
MLQLLSGRKELAMKIRRFSGAAALLVTFGIAAIAPSIGHAQSQFPLPEKGSMVTVTGCFGFIPGKQYVLARPTMDKVADVQETACTINESDQMIKLQDVKKRGPGKESLGRYMEVYGRVGAEHSNPDRVRKLHLESYRFIPQAPPPPPQVAIVEVPAPAPMPPAIAPAPPAPVEQPVGTAGVMRKALPKTASSLPLVGLIGFASLAGGLTLHLLGRRRLGRA